jgi:maleate isomerase
MFGWRARIGLLSPGTSGIHTTAIEMEMLAPEGVLFVGKFLDGPRSLTVPDLRAMEPQVEPAAKELAKTDGLDLILVAGAPIVLALGPKHVIATVEAASGLPATTNVTGIVNGLRRLDARKVVVVTPYYPPEIVDLLREYLESEGVEILSLLGGGDVDFGRHKELSQQATYRSAKRAFFKAGGADALVVVGGGAPFHEVIGALETDIGKPVVASNFASLWNVLTLANVRQPIPGYGKLLTCF